MKMAAAMIEPAKMAHTPLLNGAVQKKMRCSSVGRMYCGRVVTTV